MTRFLLSPPLRDAAPSGAPAEGFARRARLRALSVGLAGVASAVLGLFHLLLLWQRVASQSLLEPTVLARWLGSIVLLAALIYLRRAGVPLLWGRRALVFWLLVLVLHLGVPGASAVPAGAHALDSGVLLVLPVIGATLVVGLWLARVAGAPARFAPPVPRHRRLPPTRRTGPRPGHGPSILSRPPPFFS